MAELIHKNDYKEFNYTGNIQSIELLPGVYQLECWGAQGGQGNDNEYANTSWNYGKGGYSIGTIEIKTKTILYICVGGRGISYAGYPAIPANSLVNGGYNGGGNTFRDSYEFGGSGGGATHIALQSGLLSSLESKKDSILLVAGGGGGSGEDNEYAGHGGSAITLPTGYHDVNTYKGTFGQGTHYVNSGESGGGGGGGYIGGYGGQGSGSNGGTGYANPILYNINGQTGVRDGHGFAKITLLKSIFLSYNYDNGIEDITINPESYDIGDTVELTPILKQGYLWDKWTGDIESLDETLSITIEDYETLISVYANSKPGPTTYTINHYIQNLDITTYTLQDTEILDGITNDIVYPDIKTYKGFTSPDIQSITLKNDGTTILNYYYTRNKYKASVISDGHTNKSEYYFEEHGEIIYDNTLDNIYVFTGWRTNHKINIINNGLKTCKFYMPANDIEFYVTYILNRLNSNIYKNIFPEEVINMDFINKSLANTIISTEDIRQDNHGLSVKDFVYLDDDGLYKKALAEESTRANVVGIVSKVAGPNVFTLMDSGTIPFNHLDYNDTTILYLSDKIPGKAVHYSEISNTIYIPVAVYIEDKIIIHLQQGSIGDILAPYEEEEQSFETYTEQELNDVINQITNGVK